MRSNVVVAGVGMTKFSKPGENESYLEMGKRAVSGALEDAGIKYEKVEQGFVGYVYGDSTCGQNVLYKAGMTGIPIVNVNNNCSTGSSALYLARQAIEHKISDCVIAVGFEQMRPGALSEVWTDRPSPLLDFDKKCKNLVGSADIPLTLKYFGGAGLSHMKKYGSSINDFAKIRAKASRHAKNNPLALFRNEISEEDVLNSPEIWPNVMTKLMACPPTCGAAAAILVSPEFATALNINSSVRIIGQTMTTDDSGTFESDDMIQLVGYDMSKAAAQQVYEQTSIGPEDVSVVELHDCFAQNELLTYEALGLCPEGGASKFINESSNTYGGDVVTNPSGGLLCKGHPLGATGLAQCYELTHQLRGTAEERQVDTTKIAMQHNLGLGGACVVTMYQRS